ncbi:MAG TPA: Uma2 family endonuclease [Rhodothermales bacterium]|nr:Uma2 family endonuclease [Rhodothermales bacterium]
METTTLWSRVLADPQLRDLPYKVETEGEKIVLSPHKVKHSLLQGSIMNLIEEHVVAPGKATMEFAIETTRGVKVPDVVWLSSERLARLRGTDPEASPFAPEICVEVLSSANTQAEMREKRRLYFEQGAREVWICSEKGEMQFYHAGEDTPAGQSRFIPTFPARVDLE